MERNNSFGQLNRANLPTGCEHIASIMRQVQQCPWSPFKLNEIVTLEKCLQEISATEPRFSLVLKKLASESVFVEPTRKLKHLTRTRKEELADVELKRRATELRGRIELLDREIEFYKGKVEHLLEREQENKIQIFQMEKSIVSRESVCKFLSKEFELLLERVLNSFVSSISLIQADIPDFIATICESNLVQQAELIEQLHRRYLMRVKRFNEPREQQVMTQLSYQFRLSATSRLSEYLKRMRQLLRDLILIDKVYSIEIPAELNHFKTLQTHIDFLEKPICGAPKRITYVYNDLEATVDLPNLAGGPPDSLDDPEIGQMFGSIMELCK